MALAIYLNATLRRYRSDYNPFEGITLEAAPGTTVAQILTALGIPAQEVTLAMVDGRRRELDYVLEGNERLALFPPIGGG